MGRMDCISIDHFDNRFWRGDMCDETDFGQPESKEKEDCRECGNERRKLLQSSKYFTKGRSYKPEN
jgi:hypothetical protein